MHSPIPRTLPGGSFNGIHARRTPRSRQLVGSPQVGLRLWRAATHVRTLDEAPWQATRRAIDLSGDGVNNSGPPVEQARDRAVTEGITINGLPILNDRPGFGVPSAVPLDEYYRQNVVGGPGAFVIAVEEFESFGLAVRRKLIREISDIPPVPRMAARASAPKPTEAGEGAASRPEADLATDGD
jgi:hypothetical protein